MDRPQAGSIREKKKKTSMFSNWKKVFCNQAGLKLFLPKTISQGDY